MCYSPLGQFFCGFFCAALGGERGSPERRLTQGAPYNFDLHVSRRVSQETGNVRSLQISGILARDEAQFLEHHQIRRVTVFEFETAAVARALGRVGTLVEAPIEYLGLEVPVHALEPE